MNDVPPVPGLRHRPLVSVVVTTRNEERHIGNCLRAVRMQSYPRERIEIVVVDNGSTDRTVTIAREFTDKVFDHGPERAAQRNHGIIERATGELALFLDADMMPAPATLEQGVDLLLSRGLAGVYIREIVLGRGLTGRARRFERSFYDGTVVDCVRLFSRRAFMACGGFDAALPPGPEDWDFDRRLRALGEVAVLGDYRFRDMDRIVRRLASPAELLAACRRGEVTAPVIFHDETGLGLRSYLAKKARYAPRMDAYAAKLGRNDREVRKQLGAGYRFAGVFIENGKWRRLLAHPLLAAWMYAMRAGVGMAYLTRGRRRDGDGGRK